MMELRLHELEEIRRALARATQNSGGIPPSFFQYSLSDGRRVVSVRDDRQRPDGVWEFRLSFAPESEPAEEVVEPVGHPFLRNPQKRAIGGPQYGGHEELTSEPEGGSEVRVVEKAEVPINSAQSKRMAPYPVDWVTERRNGELLRKPILRHTISLKRWVTLSSDMDGWNRLENVQQGSLPPGTRVELRGIEECLDHLDQFAYAGIDDLD